MDRSRGVLPGASLIFVRFLFSFYLRELSGNLAGRLGEVVGCSSEETPNHPPMNETPRNDQPSGPRHPRIQLALLHRNRLFVDCLHSVFAGLGAFEPIVLDHRDPGYLQLIEAKRPDLLLVDTRLPDRMAAKVTHFVLNSVGRGKILLLGSLECRDILFECIGAGAQGCVLEDSTLSELQLALERIYHGEPYCSSFLLHTMLQHLSGPVSQSRYPDNARSNKLTFREQEILQLVSEHLSNKEIAKRLLISVYTVKNHLHNIVEKLQVESRYEAVEYARQRKWITPFQPH